MSGSSTEPRAGVGTGWCELHCHSAYSLLDGASRPEDLAERAAALSYPALALTDHDSLAGLLAHARACMVAGVRPIAGCELTLDAGTHLTLLARDAAGYRSLATIVSTARLAGPKGAPGATLDDLARSRIGIECLTGCRRGAVPAALLAGDESRARAALGALRDMYGAAHTWVEVQRPGLPDDARLSFNLARLARRAGVGVVATGDAHYTQPGDRPLQDVLVCIRERVPLARALPHLRPGGAWALQSPAEMARRFVDLPAALRGAAELAGRCGFDPGHVDARLPAFPVPGGETADTYLRRLARDGAREHYGHDIGSAIRGRLDHELAVVASLEMADYILIVHDIVRYARSRGILCQGRGSAVGSLVCYCLGITAVEPLGHGLSFERFLAPGRADPPDIDVDFPSDRGGDRGSPAREAVIQYALSRWSGHATLVATTITFRARSAIRDVGMGLGLSPGQIDAVAGDAGPDGGAAGMGARGAGAMPGGGGAHGAHGPSIADSPVLRRLRYFCERLDGLPRHLGQHPGGVVVTRRPLAEVAPLEPARMSGRVIVQWDKDAAEDAGLAKIDILGLGMLTVIDACFAMIERETGTRPTLHGFRCDDPAVYDAFCRSDTVGVFQLESRAQMTACLPPLQPRCYEDLIAAVALIRPGPMQGNATHPFLHRRQGLEPVRYPGGEAGRRLLGPILGETYGVILYQDQCIDVARACGLDPGEAAELRRAMSSARSPARMAALRDRLDRGLADRGLDAAARAEVLASVQAFAGYGFVKGHSAAFGYLAYVSCWLKIYHPAAFCAALLNAQPMGFYPPEVVVQDAERHGVRVLPVDLRRSRTDCAPEDGAVRLGWRRVQAGLNGMTDFESKWGGPPGLAAGAGPWPGRLGATGTCARGGPVSGEPGRVVRPGTAGRGRGGGAGPGRGAARPMSPTGVRRPGGPARSRGRRGNAGSPACSPSPTRRSRFLGTRRPKIWRWSAPPSGSRRVGMCWRPCARTSRTARSVGRTNWRPYRRGHV